jgi:hypothetical protein
MTFPLERSLARLEQLHRSYLDRRIGRDELLVGLVGPLLAHRLRRGPRLRTSRLREWPEPFPSVLLTTYFASKPDPQTGSFVPRQNYAYIEPWHRSVQATGDHGVIFHDHLPDRFVSRYETDRIRFLRCDLGACNMNDERFLLYLLFLIDNPCAHVFMTDAADVTVTRSPFPLAAAGGPRKILVGRDRFNLNRHCGWIGQMIAGYETRTGRRIETSFSASPLYNAGIVGGPFYPALYLLVRLVAMLLEANGPDEYDMFALNYVIYRRFRPRAAGPGPNGPPTVPVLRVVVPELDGHSRSEHVETGYPLCSEFGKFQEGSDACFIHK